ncbi:polysaccharide deacetylase [Paenibacillus piri]|uniref:Polysaccharide deacetylase n=1 Tax=Paenibacillus piri TaxID=2547395 RepID=A0A4R5KMQ1_9BACL|nr:polysaccharide deacetylase [Paenibacillus piri]TDF96178.1 polysaccharide deacetylase [Paenibacillus piri]
MPSLLHVHRFRRIGLIVSFVLVALILLQPISNSSAFAASADNEAAQRQEIYGQLQAGKRIWADKDYAKPDQPTVYLTFDDGPSKLTDGVLNILREEGVPATFFMLGEQVKAYPEQVKQVVKDGHAIGNHTYNHKYTELYSSVQTFWNQIQQTELALEETAGVKTALIRAPGGTFGNFDAFYFYYLDQAGYEVYDWNIDSGDSARVGVPAAEIVRKVKNSPLAHEVIVLMHDGTGHVQTVKALPEIIRYFKDEGYAFAPLGPQVQPVHFSAGKMKWSRSVSPALHAGLTLEADQHRLAWEQDIMRQQAHERQIGGAQMENNPGVALNAVWMRDSLAASLASTKPPVPSEPLEVTLDGGKLLLEPNEYRLKDGHYQVPVRKLMEAMGGRTEWHADRRTASVQYGFRVLDYDLMRYELRVIQGMKRTVYHLPQMELLDGTLYVPLRTTIELLGNRVESYEKDQGRLQVKAALTGGYMLPYGF